MLCQAGCKILTRSIAVFKQYRFVVLCVHSPVNSIYTIPSHRKYIATLSGEINFLTNSGSVIIDVNLQEAVAISFDTERQRLNSPECYYKSISAELRPKRDKMAKFLQDLGMVPTVPEAGYSIVADFSNLSRFTTAIKFTVD